MEVGWYIVVLLVWGFEVRFLFKEDESFGKVWLMFDVSDGWVRWFGVIGILVKLFWGFCVVYMLFIVGLLLFNILVEKVFFLFFIIDILFIGWLLFLDLLFDDIMLFIWWLRFKFLKIFLGFVDILCCIFNLFNFSLFFICFVNLWFRVSWFDFFCEFWVFLRSF